MYYRIRIDFPGCYNGVRSLRLSVTAELRAASEISCRNYERDIQAEADTLCKQENICVNIRRPSADGNQECILKTIKLIRPFMNSDTAFASGKSKKFYALYCRAVCRNDIAGILCQGADEQIIFKNFLRKNDIGTVLLQRLLWVERNKDGGNYNNNAKEKFNCAVHNIFTAGQCGAPAYVFIFNSAVWRP